MGNCKNLDHALHNEKTCKYLDKKPDFLDWVITTAFYSALHFIRYKILPLEVVINDKKVKFSDFESFYRSYNKYGLNKHRFISEVLEEFHPKIVDEYNQLRDISWTARYVNYQYGREISNLAKKRLSNIKEYCNKTCK